MASGLRGVEGSLSYMIAGFGAFGIRVRGSWVCTCI